jgi:hypothetical protein
MERLIGHYVGHYGHYCDFCLARWEAATMFDYSILFTVIVAGGWLLSRRQSQSVR